MSGGNVYNIAPGSSSTLLELLDILGELIGVDAGPDLRRSAAGRRPPACADASAATRDLGWTPSVTLADGLARYVDWLRGSRGT